MRVFVDANILVSVINKEYPLFSHTSRILSLVNHPKFQIITSPVCLAIAFYFAEKRHKSKAKDKMKLLCDHITIADTTSDCVTKALDNPKVKDFEDGLEYYTAALASCKCIVTEDLNDFHFSDIEVLSSQDFFKKYMANRN